MALKILQLSIQRQKDQCEKVIDLLGLKYIFPILIKKGIKKEEDPLLDEYALSCIKHLLQNCDGVYLDRIINKFRDNKYEKVEFKQLAQPSH